MCYITMAVVGTGSKKIAKIGYEGQCASGYGGAAKAPRRKVVGQALSSSIQRPMVACAQHIADAALHGSENGYFQQCVR